MKNLILFILTLSHIGALYAQQADTAASDFEKIAEFKDAISIAASPRGLIYVVDQGSSSIHEFDDKAQYLRELGGPGAAAGQFDEPMDIDPTNGLILVVADAGNGRIQRFSHEFLFLESLTLGNLDRNNGASFSSQPRYRQDEDTERIGSGRPVAVRTSPDNRMYAIDAEERVIVEWDQDRNITQVIGEYSQGEGALVNPVSFELGTDGSIFVFDQGIGAIKVYDSLGGYLRVMGLGLLENAFFVESIENRIVVGLPGKLLIFQERGLLERTIELDLHGPVIDLLYESGHLYLLTARSLLRYKGDAGSLLKLDDL